MAATDPNPNVDPTITGQEAWFNKDVRVYEDLYAVSYTHLRAHET